MKDKKYLEQLVQKAFSKGEGLKMYRLNKKASVSGVYYKWHITGTIHDDTAQVVVVVNESDVYSKQYETSKAYTEVRKTIQAKYDKGYRITRLAADNFVDSRVMLSNKIHPDNLKDWFAKHNTNEFILGQPKLNGMRAVYNNGIFKSRLDTVLGKIAYEDFMLDKTLPDTLDGELYAHGYPLEEIISMVKGSTDNSELKYYVFDTMTEGMSAAMRLSQCLQYQNDRVHVVSTVPLYDYTQAEQYLSLCESKGYEGIMLKTPHGSYEFGKRAWGSTKVKRPISEEFKIVDFKRDIKSRVIWVCETTSGNQFDVVPTGTLESRMKKDAFYSQKIGKLLTIEYFEMTKYGVPRHAKGIAVRDYE